ncbi:MAG: RNA methyltransferase [Phycisphaeraceae bacterium]
MPVIPIHALEDPRVAPYRNLKDRELAAQGGLFLAEGEHLVRRLLASGLRTHSLLVAQRVLDRVVPITPDQVPIYVVSDALMTGIMGFKFHSGLMAAGVRPDRPTIGSVMESATRPGQHAGVTLLVCPQVINHDNLGALIRIAAAFGVDAMLLGERSCDPYWRRSVRVSMGAIFTLPVIRSSDIAADLQRLRDDWQVELIATVTDADAQPLSQARRPSLPGAPDRLAILVGSESQGLSADHIAMCQRRVTIPMHLGTDSLNIAVATAVMLFHFCTRPG